MTTSTFNTSATTSTHAGRVFDTATITLVNFCRRKVNSLSMMYDIYSERCEMRNLSDEMLQDMGITRAQLNSECQRKTTDIPTNRIG